MTRKDVGISLLSLLLESLSMIAQIVGDCFIFKRRRSTFNAIINMCVIFTAFVATMGVTYLRLSSLKELLSLSLSCCFLVLQMVYQV